MMKPKQVIVIRKDLKMRKGKMVSQGAHASMKIFLDMWSASQVDNETNYVLKVDNDSAIKYWLDEMFTKITVSVDSEEELVRLYNVAKDKGFPCSLIEDNGLTEFNGVKTKTAIAIGPSWSPELDEITGHLKLL